MSEVIESFANRLDKAMKHRNIKSVELHEKTGISESLISKYLSGNATARQGKLVSLSNTLDVNPVWLMGYDVPMEKTSDELKGSISLEELYKDTVPLLGIVKAGYNYLANENILEYIPIDFKKDDENYYALKVKGDSMETTFSDGDTVIVHKQDTFNSGNICIVLINGNEATIKKVYKIENGIELVALNPSFEDKKYSFEEMKKIPIQIIGVVKRLYKEIN